MPAIIGMINVNKSSNNTGILVFRFSLSRHMKRKICVRIIKIGIKTKAVGLPAKPLAVPSA